MAEYFDSLLWFTLKRDEKTWKVCTAQAPSESVTSWLIWERHASSASSHTVGWKAAKMAEKKGEGGGGNPRSSKSSTSSRKLAVGKKLADKRGNEQECSVGYILDQTELLLSNKMSNNT